jgi:hypothetical protein
MRYCPALWGVPIGGSRELNGVKAARYRSPKVPKPQRRSVAVARACVMIDKGSGTDALTPRRKPTVTTRSDHQDVYKTNVKTSADTPIVTLSLRSSLPDESACERPTPASTCTVDILLACRRVLLP